MYCPNCGDQTTQGLKYCKRCGTGLTISTTPIDTRTNSAKPLGLLLPVAAVAIAGFLALFITIANITQIDTRALVAITAFGGATVVGVVGLLVWLLLRLTTGYRPPAHYEKEKPVVREYIAQQLTPPPISASSVTEHTTRNFDPSLYREKGGLE